MVTDFMPMHRLISKINKAYKQRGIRRIFITGKGLDDIFLWNFREGCYKIHSTLKMFAFKSGMKYFIHIKDSGKISYFTMEKGNILEINRDEVILKKRKGLADDISKIKGETFDFKESKKEDNINPLGEKDRGKTEENDFTSVMNLLSTPGEGEVLVYIEAFDWLANFYGAEKDHQKVRRIQKIKDINKHLVVIAFNDLNILERDFYEDIKGEHIIQISHPPKEEIFFMLHRECWKQIGYSPRSLNINSLASIMSSNAYALRECNDVFGRVLTENGKNIKYENFNLPAPEEKVLWKDVHLEEGIKQGIQLTLEEFKRGDKDARKGLLLKGPPGTGKTMIAKALANEAEMYFVSPNLSDLKAGYVGQSAPKVKELFEEARNHQPSLIFFDEVDTLFPSRGGTTGDPYTVDMVNEFLTQVDGVSAGKQRIFVVAATNRPQLLDSAVLSRLGKPYIDINLPDKKERILLFKSHLKNIDDTLWNTHSIMQDLEVKSKGMSGRDIKIFCSDLAKRVTGDLQWSIAKENPNEFYEKFFLTHFQEYKRFLVKELREECGINCSIPGDFTEELFGYEKIKTRIFPYFSEILKNRDHVMKEIRSNLECKRKQGIILYAPSGNGKTKIAQQMASENRFYFVNVESKDLLSISERDTIDKLDRIVDHVMKISRLCNDDEGVVLFFDEFDSIFSKTVGSSIRSNILGILMDEKNLRNENTKIIVMAATNFIEVIDEAIIRAGRFDEQILIDNPNKETAITILESLIRKKNEKYLECSFSNEELILLYDRINELKINECEKRFCNQYIQLLASNKVVFDKLLEFEKAKWRMSCSDINKLVEDLLSYAIDNCCFLNKSKCLKIDKKTIESYIEFERSKTSFMK